MTTILSSSSTTTVWRGERANAQILVLVVRSVGEQVRVSTQDLRSAEGNIIPKDRITFELVRYVLSDLHYAEKKAIVRGICAANPDFLMPKCRCGSATGRLRSPCPNRHVRVWMMVDVPREEPAPRYVSKAKWRCGRKARLLNY